MALTAAQKAAAKAARAKAAKIKAAAAKVTAAKAKAAKAAAAVGSAAAGASASSGSSLRSDASATVKDFEGRLSQFRTDCGSALEKYFDRSFDYAEGVLGDSSSTDWVKDGLALWIGYYGASRDLYQAAYKLYTAPAPPSSK